METALKKNYKSDEFIKEGNLWKVMFELSWPAVIAMLLYGLNIVFDAIFVGRFVGESAFAGISFAFPLAQIPLGIGQLIGGGAGAVLSIVIGSNNIKTQRKLLGNINFLTIVLSLAFMTLGLFFNDSLIKMMGASGKELEFGVNYFRICLYGTIFWVAGLAGNLIVRAEGKMKTAALMMGIGLVVNIVCTYVFIVIFNWGVEGAALGTNIGMAVYSLTFVVYILKKKATFDAVLFSMTVNRDIVKSIFSNGAPLFIMSVMMVVQGIVVLNALTNYGTTSDLTLYGTVFRIMSFMTMPMIAFMRSLQPVVGINFGARNYVRAIKSLKVWCISGILFVLPFWIFLMVNPQIVLNWFFQGKDFSLADISNFRYFMAPLPFLSIVFMGMTFFPAINKGSSAAIIGISRQLIFYVPVMLLMPKFFGIEWVYIGSFLIDLVIFIWITLLLCREFKNLNNGSFVKALI